MRYYNYYLYLSAFVQYKNNTDGAANSRLAPEWRKIRPKQEEAPCKNTY